MKSFNKIITASSLAFICIALISCKDTPAAAAPITKFWKLKTVEIWWVSPNDPNGDYLNIDTLPSGIDFPDANGTHHVYTGSERNITRTDTPLNDTAKVINYSWEAFPDTLEAGVYYTLYYRSGGTALNGISISYPIRYDTHPTAWSAASMRDGDKLIKFRITEPSETNPMDMKMVVTMTSGSYYYIDYVYIYEWVQN